MEIVKAATDWAKAEVFSSLFFIFFGILFLIGSVAFWQLGKSVLATTFTFSTIIAGTLLLLAGFGFYNSNKTRLANFESEYKADPLGFITSEIARTEKTKSAYQNIALRVFPLIIVLSAILIIFTNRPLWRAMSITVIGFFTVILLLDSNALERIETYNLALKSEHRNLID